MLCGHTEMAHMLLHCQHLIAAAYYLIPDSELQVYIQNYEHAHFASPIHEFSSILPHEENLPVCYTSGRDTAGRAFTTYLAKNRTRFLIFLNRENGS